jgi:MoaA/NifB/PqqE/SkfB family radical SAM enzyme
VLGAVFEVSNTLGAGFPEKVYERALLRELGLRGIRANAQVSLAVTYGWIRWCHVYRTSALFLELRDADTRHGKCGYYEYRRLCGGSRARAYALSGDYLG